MIRVNEIFYSLQGETTMAGFTSVFVRLTGCNLSCRFCDTKRAMDYGEEMTVSGIVERVRAMEPFDHVTVTGGEPLLQNESFELLEKLAESGYSVQVETNGSVDFTGVSGRVRIIADVKTPSSGEENSFNMKNIERLGVNDEVKFVISDRADYDFSLRFMKENMPSLKCVVNFSPAFGTMSASELSGLIVSDRLNVRLNVQLHKIADFK